MKKKLIIIHRNGKFKSSNVKSITKDSTWHDTVRYYFPNATDEECDYILWEETCFPLSGEETLKQLWEVYKNRNK